MVVDGRGQNASHALLVAFSLDGLRVGLQLKFYLQDLGPHVGRDNLGARPRLPEGGTPAAATCPNGLGCHDDEYRLPGRVEAGRRSPLGVSKETRRVHLLASPSGAAPAGLERHGLPWLQVHWRRGHDDNLVRARRALDANNLGTLLKHDRVVAQDGVVPDLGAAHPGKVGGCFVQESTSVLEARSFRGLKGHRATGNAEQAHVAYALEIAWVKCHGVPVLLSGGSQRPAVQPRHAVGVRMYNGDLCVAMAGVHTECFGSRGHVAGLSRSAQLHDEVGGPRQAACCLLRGRYGYDGSNSRALSGIWHNAGGVSIPASGGTGVIDHCDLA